MNCSRVAAVLLAVTALAVLVDRSVADILVRTDGGLLDGKVRSEDSAETVFQPDGADEAQAQHLPRGTVSRVIRTDEHGAVLPDPSAPRPEPEWSVPPEPAAPSIVPAPAGKKTYYLIPLHGEVGQTILASALEKSLADAVLRKPSVVVLDIDSPGGLVEEAQKITKVLHRYNKRLRIIALADKDLSAAAILSLSVREIYVKSSSTIGAATSYEPTNLNLPPKIEEKMQSAWRATARNSAEEGGHEPLLAEAMIDNDMELHLETVNGKAVVKEGPGDREICRKGKILTLTSHEAIECGLASGEADDLDELADDLKMTGWSECKGLGTLLADYLPKRSEALKAQSQKIMNDFQEQIERAKQSAPSEQVSQFVVRGPMIRQPMIPGRPMYRPGAPRVVTRVTTFNWKPKSLECVVALQNAEADLAKEAQLCEAFGQQGVAELFREARDKIGAVRAMIYDDRNKYGGGRPATPPAPPTNLTAQTPGAAPVTPIPGTPEGMPPGATQTKLAGVGGGVPYHLVDSAAAPVVGFHFVLGDWNGKTAIRQLHPLFGKPPHNPPNDPSLLFAREGYAVAGLLVRTDEQNVLGIQVMFARVRGGRLAIGDSYKSNWIGVSAGNGPPQELITTQGRFVIGTCGRQAVNLSAIGLVLAPPAGTLRQAQQSERPAIGGGGIGGETETVGGPGGQRFVSVNPASEPFPGFRYQLGGWNGKLVVRRLDPIFDRDAANAIPGSTTVLAREGFVVAGLKVESDRTNVTAVQVLFAPYRNGRLIREEIYASPWIGVSIGRNLHQLGGNGKLVVGVCGRRGMNLDAVGLVFKPEP